jgi:alpha-glucuronidase
MVLAVASLAHAEDGYELWLRYRLLAPEPRAALARVAASIVAPAEASATLRAALAELQAGVSGLTGRPVSVTATATDGSLVIGTPRSSARVARLELPLSRTDLPAAPLWREGYLIRTVELDGRSTAATSP